MGEKERLVSFSMLGQDYSFYTGASEEEMSKILSLVRQLVDENGDGMQGATIPVSKTAIMACLNIASRYIKLKMDFDEYKKNSEVRAYSLIEEINERLAVEKTDKGV